MRAARDFPARSGLLDGLETGLRPAALDPGDPRAHLVAGQPAIHEDDASVMACESLAAQRDVGHFEC